MNKTNMINFFVPGIPIPKGRPRIALRGRYPHAYTPKKTADYEDKVRLCAIPFKPVEPWTGAIYADLVFIMPRPKAHKKSQYHTVKPDLDNMIKCLDALNGLIYRDDSQIVQINAVKIYEDETHAVGVDIFLKHLEV